MVNVGNLIIEKETQFIEHLMNMELGELLTKLSMNADSFSIVDFIDLFEAAEQAFVFYLLEDTDFLNLNIINHFYEERGVHIFAIEFLDRHEPRRFRSEVISEWIALVVDTASNIVTFRLARRCRDSDSVQDSHFRGKPLKSILPLIGNDFVAQIK